MANSTVIIPFSGSTQGEPVKVTATGTPGTLIHTTGVSATVVDRIFLWAINTQAAATASTVLATVEFGGATAPDFNIPVPISGQGGPQMICDGFPLLGNGVTALTVKVFAATTAVINIVGYVLRIVP
jgi:hypothetical protein